MKIWSAAACCRLCIAASYRCKGASKLAHSKEPAIFEADSEVRIKISINIESRAI
jgi:hypothetical protein